MTQRHYKNGAAFPPLKPGVLRMYSMRFCPFAERTALVLAHKEIPHEVININLSDKPDWMWSKNPLGLVPILELDGKVVYESTATCEWLDDVYPQYRLQPSDPYRRAWDRILLEHYGKVTSAFYGLLFRPDENENTPEDLGKHFKFYNDILAQRGGPFFGDNGPSMIDFYMWPHLRRFRTLSVKDSRFAVEDTKYPKLAEWFEAMRAAPAVKATYMDEKSLSHFLDTYKDRNPDYDYGLEE